MLPEKSREHSEGLGGQGAAPPCPSFHGPPQIGVDVASGELWNIAQYVLATDVDSVELPVIAKDVEELEHLCIGHTPPAELGARPGAKARTASEVQLLGVGADGRCAPETRLRPGVLEAGDCIDLTFQCVVTVEFSRVLALRGFGRYTACDIDRFPAVAVSQPAKMCAMEAWQLD